MLRELSKPFPRPKRQPVVLGFTEDDVSLGQLLAGGVGVLALEETSRVAGSNLRELGMGVTEIVSEHSERLLVEPRRPLVTSLCSSKVSPEPAIARERVVRPSKLWALLQR